MLVQQILKSKATDGVITLTVDATLSEAAALLSSKKIGTIVVSNNGKSADGILSERDIVRELGRRGAGCMTDKLEDVMTKKLVTCTLTDRVDDILQSMTDGRFRHMPVLENGELVGLISIGDVVKAKLAELSMEKDALQGMIMGH
ncbi:CBS domain-containing protein [Falsihalocynthiibacter arcticus]|uniref:Histidine kinase n=1 Tax=Falsihalocynthiibacter arcticus TaxID=1579316 RepID=A0A126V283_9RHOB|nr:CBS domain-containing protein [Falsihalocynthiibacter arcticus]AML52441.1 histidine kinase [Falsihalocynthiibacter arcticus]